MRTTVTLTDDVYAHVRRLAEAQGRSMGAVLSDLVRRSVSPPAVDDGWPTFPAAPDAELIPWTRATDLLADEGLE